MKRSARLGRRVLVMLAVTIGVLASTVGMAFAHFPVVSGSVVCTNGQHVITWSAWNNSGGTPDVMVLQGVMVTQGGQVVGTVVGFGNGTQLAPGVGDTITGTTTLPGTMSGTIRLTIIGTYPGTTFPNTTRTAEVVLPSNCVPVTTTTTTAPTTTTTLAPTTTVASTTTTTTAPTTTTTAPATTTAPTAPPTTGATQPQVTSTTAATTTTTIPTVTVSNPGGGGGAGNPVPGDSGRIAFTGSDSGPLLGVSIAALAAGLVALNWSRRRNARLER